MPEPTAFADELANLPPNLRDRLNRHLPDEPENDAERLAAAERADEAHRQEVIDAAEQACAERFPIRYRQAITDRADMLAWVREFTADPASARSLLLLGPTGTGKTHQAYGAIRAATATAFRTRVGGYRSPRWIGMTYAELTASLRPRGRDYDTEEVLSRYVKTELLFIDDLGAAKASEWVEEATYRLINGRYQDMRPSIFTSNLALPELKEAVGDRIASRLSEMCVRVVLDGPDRRRGQGSARMVAPRREPVLEPDPPKVDEHEAWWLN